MSKLSMNKISEILRQRNELNRSYRNIAQSLNISVSTVFHYLSHAKLANIQWPLSPEMTEEELHKRLFLPVAASDKSNGERPLPDWENVQKEYRKKGVR